MKKKLLINFVYYRPVGHVVEALKCAKGFYETNKSKVDIYLLLNADSPMELASTSYWIKKVYPISLQDVWKNGEKAKTLKEIPKIWDYIVSYSPSEDFKPGYDEKDLIKAQKILQSILKAKISEGYYYAPNRKNSPILPIKLNPKVTFPIPPSAKKFAAKYKHKGVKICIMLGGSAGTNQSPSVKMWLKICKALDKKFSNLKIYFTGVTKGEKGRTKTQDFTKKDVSYLINNLSNAVNCFDIGIWNQLALIKQCDIFLSPHTGFAFLAPCVGTPWLELANCPWNAYIFNSIKFYSVLPGCGHYPSRNEIKKGCGKRLWEDKKCYCMMDKYVEKKIPEIVKAAKLLLNKKFTYKKAVDLHIQKLERLKSNIYPIDSFFFGGIKGLK